QTTCGFAGSADYRARPAARIGWSGPGQPVVDLPGDVALEDADYLGFGAALGQAAGHVGPRAGVVAQPGDHDAPQGAVGLPVPAAVEPVAGHLPGGGGDGGGAAQVRPGGFGPQPPRAVRGGGPPPR